MEPRTDTANSKNWVEASKDLKIAAYIENRVLTLTIREKPLPIENFYDALKELSVPFPRVPSLDKSQPDLEFQAWDALSDEALIHFEQALS